MKTAKSTMSTKRKRRAHRAAKERRRHDDGLHLHPIGGIMDADLQERILAAARRSDPSAPWSVAAPQVLPVIKRVTQPFPPDLAPFTITVPPGIPTGFGIDLGPALSHVTAAMLESWAVDTATVLATALDNLRRLVHDEGPRIETFSIEGETLLAVGGQGWGSALVLVPDVLARIVGPEPCLLMTPVRNTLIALPESVDADFAVDVWLAFTHGAHDELDIEPMRWTGREVVGLADHSPSLPN